MKNFKLTSEYITLGQLIKAIGLISNGGHAKEFLANNYAIVNGVQENRRGKKLFAGDQVEILGQKIVIE